MLNNQKLGLLHLASHIFWFYIMEGLNKPVILELKTLFYFNKTIIANLIRN